ncbi:MAG TPA: hypothetical protein VF530_21800 [Planctomycetota bacterium]
MRARALALVAALAAGARTEAQAAHEDARYGFKIQPPRGWKPIPRKAEENWLVAKFLCDEKDHWTDKNKGSGWTWEHQPELMVIAFVAAAIEKGKQGEEVEPPEGVDEVRVFTNPYEDYEDYLDRTYSGGGFYVSAREEDTSNDLPVTKLEIKVEKLATTGPKRIVTWVYHAEGVDFAVQAEVLESAFDKRKAALLGALRSFRTIPRTHGPLPTEAGTADGLFISFSSMRKGTPAERKERRQASELALHARAKRSLPPGWQVRDHERFLLLFNTDPGAADKVAAAGAALLAWADESLGFIGKEEYVRRPILRVCATTEEKESLQRGVHASDSFGFEWGLEIVTCKDERGATGWEMDWVNQRLLDLWLRDRDEEIWLGMPGWVGHGLDSYVEGARLSGRKLKFREDEWLSEDFRLAVKQGKHAPLRDLVQMTGGQFLDADNDFSGLWNRMGQADAVVRFLLSPEAGRKQQTKTLLFDYLRNLRDVVLELRDFDEGQEKVAEPKTEEEEEELYRKRAKAWQATEREQEVVKRTFQRTFGGWSDKDWQAFEKAFLDFVD